MKEIKWILENNESEEKPKIVVIGDDSTGRLAALKALTKHHVVHIPATADLEHELHQLAMLKNEDIPLVAARIDDSKDITSKLSDLDKTSFEHLITPIEHKIKPIIDLIPDVEYFLPRKPLKGKLVEVRTEPKIGRNSKCPCGSGKKNKNCCKK